MLRAVRFEHDALRELEDSLTRTERHKRRLDSSRNTARDEALAVGVTGQMKVTMAQLKQRLLLTALTQFQTETCATVVDAYKCAHTQAQTGVQSLQATLEATVQWCVSSRTTVCCLVLLLVIVQRCLSFAY